MRDVPKFHNRWKFELLSCHNAGHSVCCPTFVCLSATNYFLFNQQMLLVRSPWDQPLTPGSNPGIFPGEHEKGLCWIGLTHYSTICQIHRSMLFALLKVVDVGCHQVSAEWSLFLKRNLLNCYCCKMFELSASLDLITIWWPLWNCNWNCRFCHSFLHLEFSFERYF